MQIFMAHGHCHDSGDEQFHAFTDPDEAMAFVDKVEQYGTHSWTVLTLNTQDAKGALEDYNMYLEMEGL